MAIKKLWQNKYVRSITQNETRRKVFIVFSMFVVIALASFLTIANINSKLGGASDTNVPKKFSGELQKTPDFQTVLPTGKTIEQLGGWTRVSPSDRNPVFAYVDTINGKQINVSQQPLPPEFKEDTNSQIEQLATGYKATEKVTVGETTVFIGTSAKGPQSAILAVNNLLILIKSSVPISEDEWASYVKTLK